MHFKKIQMVKFASLLIGITAPVNVISMSAKVEHQLWPALSINDSTIKLFASKDEVDESYKLTKKLFEKIGKDSWYPLYGTALVANLLKEINKTRQLMNDYFDQHKRPLKISIINKLFDNSNEFVKVAIIAASSLMGASFFVIGPGSAYEILQLISPHLDVMYSFLK